MRNINLLRLNHWPLAIWLRSTGTKRESFLPFCVFTLTVYIAMRILTVTKQWRTGNRHTAMVAVLASIRCLKVFNEAQIL